MSYSAKTGLDTLSICKYYNPLTNNSTSCIRDNQCHFKHLSLSQFESFCYNQSPHTLREIAFCYQSAENFQCSNYVFNKLIQIDQNHPVNNFGFAQSFEGLGNYKSSEKYYQNALKLSPSDDRCHSLYANFLHTKLSDYITAKKYYVNALKLNTSNPFTHCNYGKLLEDTQLFDDAEYHYLKCINISPKHRKCLYYLAIFYHYRKVNLNESKKYFDELIRIISKNEIKYWYDYYEYGKLLKDMKYCNEAIINFKIAVKHCINDIEKGNIYYEMGLVYDGQLYDVTSAEYYFNKAMEFNGKRFSMFYKEFCQYHKIHINGNNNENNENNLNNQSNNTSFDNNNGNNEWDNNNNNTEMGNDVLNNNEWNSNNNSTNNWHGLNQNEYNEYNNNNYTTFDERPPHERINNTSPPHENNKYNNNNNVSNDWNQFKSNGNSNNNNNESNNTCVANTNNNANEFTSNRNSNDNNNNNDNALNNTHVTNNNQYNTNNYSNNTNNVSPQHENKYNNNNVSNNWNECKDNTNEFKSNINSNNNNNNVSNNNQYNTNKNNYNTNTNNSNNNWQQYQNTPMTNDSNNNALNDWQDFKQNMPTNNCDTKSLSSPQIEFEIYLNNMKLDMYYNQFVSLGYADMRYLDILDDNILINEVKMSGIHSAYFKKQINKFVESRNIFELWLKKLGYDLYSEYIHIFERNGIFNYESFYRIVQNKKCLIKMIGINNEVDADIIWNNTPKQTRKLNKIQSQQEGV